MRSRNTNLTRFGKYVLKALIDRGMTQQQLAETIGASPQYLSKILHGTRSAGKYVPAIIAALGLDPGKAERFIAA